MDRSAISVLLAFPATLAGLSVAPGKPPALTTSASVAAIAGKVICHSPPPVVCRRPQAGGYATEPPQLFSRAGRLSLELDYVSSADEAGRKLFCFVTPDGLESPTLHVRPGDILHIHLKNLVLAASAAATGKMAMAVQAAGPCGASAMDATSVNIHFHGTHTSPTCHADDVLHTLVNSGQSFDYQVRLPKTQPPGLYWYHPHVHGQSEAAVQGGASGAIVVDGVETFEPVAGLPERTLIVRDQTVAGNPAPGGAVPTSDLTLNYVPIAYPALTPAKIAIKPGGREFWRVLNASAETVLDLALVYDGVDQPLDIVGLDGVPIGAHGERPAAKTLTANHILIPAAGRAEFIIRAPSAKVGQASLVTRAVAMGPDGDNDTARTLARLAAAPAPLDASAPPETTPSAPAPGRAADRLEHAPITARRKLYFSETLPDPYDPTSQAKYFITVDGATPQAFNPASPPAIITTEGAVEEWTIENRSREMHEFHIHQLHFKLTKRDGEALPPDQQQEFDTVQVPFWKGSGPYPSITVRLDFGGVTGDLLYHCHLLDHEDGGMMAVVRVLPRGGSAKTAAG
ncbi:MAG: multicopper oxidase domain-containing protein [Caulobacteraceae bacterium]|nr:multicopper oxidase domain-containing protein [Caulobacteraceae bacterium]